MTMSSATLQRGGIAGLIEKLIGLMQAVPYAYVALLTGFILATVVEIYVLTFM